MFQLRKIYENYIIGLLMPSYKPLFPAEGQSLVHSAAGRSHGNSQDMSNFGSVKQISTALQPDLCLCRSASKHLLSVPQKKGCYKNLSLKFGSTNMEHMDRMEAYYQW